MARRGTSVRATWMPDWIAMLIRKRGYSGYTDACKANGISPTSLKKIADNPPPGVVNVVKLAQDLAQGDPKLAWKIVQELSGQLQPSGVIIVQPGAQKNADNSYILLKLTA